MNNEIYNQTTNRLTLRKLKKQDCSFILELVNSEGWIKFIGDRNVHTESDSLKYIENILNKDKVKYLVVTFKDKTQIGIITLIKRDYLEFYDIGFAFLPSYINNGYAFEASKVVLSYIVKSTDFRAILAVTVPANNSSIKLIEKLGLIFYKTDIQENEELSVYKVDLDKL